MQLKSRLLFIEGPSGIGKSTLLKTCLNQAASVSVRGFHVLRHLCPATQKAICFSMHLLQSLQPNPTLNYPLQSVSRPHTHVFLRPDQGYDLIFLDSFAAKLHASVFPADDETAGIYSKIYNDSQPPLILLDEIGGVDLLSAPFRNTLYAILESGLPCVGVLKSRENAKHMQRRLKNPLLSQQMIDFRDYLLRRGADIRYFHDRSNLLKYEEPLKKTILQMQNS